MQSVSSDGGRSEKSLLQQPSVRYLKNICHDILDRLNNLSFMQAPVNQADDPKPLSKVEAEDKHLRELEFEYYHRIEEELRTISSDVGKDF